MKVSVSMITYNHEKFIAQAVESVLMQQTNFDYELVIGEDCSTDKTREILLDYQKKYPDKIRLFARERNVGMRQNGHLTRSACTGQYMAFLEGDDYWTDPHKLQKQADYLDAHPECAYCCHRVAVLYDGKEDDSFGAYWPKGDQAEINGFVEVLTGACEVPNCSVMIRRELQTSMPDWFIKMPIGDYPMFCLCAQHGTVYYSSEVMAVYRRHPQGLTSSWDWSKPVLNRRLVCKHLLRTVDRRYHPAIRALIGEQAYILSIGYEQRGEIAKARRYALERILYRHHQKPLEHPVRQYIRLWVPGLHRLAKGLKGRLQRRVGDV